MTDAVARCPCGQVEVRLREPPLFRAFCHCTICQRFNQAPFADITVFRRSGIELLQPFSVSFSTMRPPPNVQRGACRNCGNPAVEVAVLPILADLAMVPSANIVPLTFTPAPVFHMFYRHRTADVDDALPKHAGYIASQLAFVGQLLRSPRRA